MFKQRYSLTAKVETICFIVLQHVCKVHVIVHLYFLSKQVFLFPSHALVPATLPRNQQSCNTTPVQRPKGETKKMHVCIKMTAKETLKKMIQQF